MSSEIKDYNKDIEDLFIQFMVSNNELFARCKAILQSEFFSDSQNQKVVRFLMSHSDQYSNIPDIAQIKAVTGKTIELIPELAATQDSWFLAEFEQFCRYKSLRAAIFNGPDLLAQGKYGEVETSVKKAVQLALVKDLGTDYFSDPKGRLERLKASNGQISIGWKEIDKCLYGGLNRGEMTLILGQSGAGKSLVMQNIGVNWALAGLNVVYITLELSENLCSMRIDSMTTGYESRDIMKNIDEVDLKIKTIHKKHKGNLRIKQLPNGCTSNDIRAFVKELEIQSGSKVDALIIDYLDLMMPASQKVNVGDMFVKDKLIAEELRNLAVELNVLEISASQLNRGSFDAVDFDPSHIAGGISKIYTADNTLAIYTTAAMKESGRYQLQFVKTRSSAGVGSKVDLAFNIKSLRITDLEDGQEGSIMSSARLIQDSLRTKSVVTAPVSTDESTSREMAATGMTSATNLRDFLKRR